MLVHSKRYQRIRDASFATAPLRVARLRCRESVFLLPRGWHLFEKILLDHCLQLRDVQRRLGVARPAAERREEIMQIL